MKERIKTAVEFLKEGQSFKVENLKLGIESSRLIHITGWSQYYNLENLTKPIALKELQRIKDLFDKMINISTELREFIQDKSLEYILAFNSGQGAIGICSEKDKVLTWEVDLDE